MRKVLRLAVLGVNLPAELVSLSLP